MATVTKVQLKCGLDNGKSTVINLPMPLNMTLTDEDTGAPLHPSVFPAVKDAFETDDGAHIKSISFHVIKTTTSVIAENYSG